MVSFMDFEEEDWRDDALCQQTDPEAFFPEKGGSTRDAKRICASCEVRSQCLQYALANEERFGIWGGLSERERRKLKTAQTGLQHGSNGMYSRGCHDEERCPRGVDGRSCVEAHREYQRAWALRNPRQRGAA